MKKEEFNELAIRVIQEAKYSRERALERLDTMEGECFQRGLFRLLPKVYEARKYVQIHCFDY